MFPLRKNSSIEAYTCPKSIAFGKDACGLEDPVLCHGVLHLVLLDDDLLLQNLDGVQVVGRLLAAQDHLPKCSLSKNFQELEIFEGLK